MAFGVAPSTECERAGCGQQIGHENYVVCWDGIESKTTVFHSRCNPADPNLQRHHHIGLAPIQFGLSLSEMAIGSPLPPREFPTLSLRLQSGAES